MRQMTILHVEDDPNHAALVARLLSGLRTDFELQHVGTATEAVRAVTARQPALVLLDQRLPDGDGMQVLAKLRSAYPSLPVIFVTVIGSPRLIVQALRAGATDYVVKDQELSVVLPRVVSETLEGAKRSATATSGMGEPHHILPRAPNSDAPRPEPTDPLTNLVGPSPAMTQVRAAVRMAAATVAPVLIEGETGTGKELVARAIHALGARAARPFVPVNCAAIPETLAESEFFGHTRGAFTGAYREKDGLFEAGRGGTVFLDEIEDLPLPLQAKMLRVLQDMEYRPVGTNTTRRADVRVIAATNQSSARLLQQHRLRPDLYYRLRVLSIVVPALRLRREDIPALAEHFLARFNARNSIDLGPLPPTFLGRLCAAAWPGNVRELENTLEALCVAAHGSQSSLEAIVSDLPHGTLSPAPLDERSRILHALEANHWSRQAVARALGISRVTLWRRMVRLGIRDSAEQEQTSGSLR
jgi:two-component system response regulator PilR (NtrC family)